MDDYSFTAGLFTGAVIAFAMSFAVEMLIRLIKNTIDLYYENKMYRTWRKNISDYIKKQMEDASNAGNK